MESHKTSLHVLLYVWIKYLFKNYIRNKLQQQKYLKKWYNSESSDILILHLESQILRNSGSKYVLRLRGAIIWIGQILHMEKKR